MTRRTCASCSLPPEPDRSRCAACREKRRVIAAARVAAGRCVQVGCHDPASPGRQQCDHHRAFYRRAAVRARANRTPCVVDALNDYDAIL